MNLHWAFCAFLLLLPACTKTIPSEVLTNVDHTISFRKLRQNPESLAGKTVLLGGTIIGTENAPEKTTLIVLQHTLNDRLKPINIDQSGGRFILRDTEFLDPAIYARGRRITVTGTVIGKEILPLNGTPYVYPVLQKAFLHLWPEEEVPDSEPRVYFGIGIGIGIGNYRYW